MTFALSHQYTNLVGLKVRLQLIGSRALADKLKTTSWEGEEAAPDELTSRNNLKFILQSFSIWILNYSKLIFVR